MNANKLMVDDWVLWKGKPVQVASVSGVKYSFGHIDVTLAHCNDKKLLETHDIKSIQPIPLTPEILEKNGFTKEYGVWVIYRHPSFKWFVLYKREFGYTISIGESEVTINYVYQLQQALKLCGIEKTIGL